MPAYFKESEPTGEEIWKSTTSQGRIDLFARIESHFDYEPFVDVLDQLLWKEVRNEELYDYLKDKVRLAIDFK